MEKIIIMTEDETNNIKCRCCLSEDDQLNFLFLPIHNDVTLADILSQNSSFKVSKDDGMPAYICTNCTSTIVDFYNFMLNFEENQKFLEVLLCSENKTSTADTEEPKNDNILLDLNEDVKNTKENDKKSELSKDEPEKEEMFQFPDDHHSSDDDDYSSPSSEFEEMKSVKYSCDKCGDCYLHKSGFQQHMQSRHKVKVSSFEDYSTEITIQIPKITYDFPVTPYRGSTIQEKNYFQCKTCKKIFDTKFELDEHFNTHKKHICEHCGLTFLKKSYLNDHSDMHSEERNHKCEICEKRFRSRTALGQHKKIHANLRNLVCDKCGKSFNTRSTLKTHIKLKHTKERNFPCVVCGLSFALRPWLNKHMLRRHNGEREKNYICSVCGGAYLDKTSLSRHISIKHRKDSVKYVCTTCGKNYTTKTNLARHFRNVHGFVKNYDIDSS